MAARPRGSSPILGVSSAIIGDASERLVTGASGFNHSFEVDIALVAPDPAQARRSFDDKALATLAATLAAEGQLQPVLLRPDPTARGRWIIVAGERRWRAAKMLEWRTILAIAHSGDTDVAGLIENLQRVDLSPVEEARGIARLIAEKGWSQDRAAQALGKAKSDISGTLRILNLPDDVLQEVLTSELPPTKNVLIEMARVTDPALLRQLSDHARRGTLTVKVIRSLRDRVETPPATRPSEVARPWRTLHRAGKVLTGLATSTTPMSAEEAASLRDLRDTIDLLLTAHDIRKEREPPDGS